MSDEHDALGQDSSDIHGFVEVIDLCVESSDGVLPPPLLMPVLFDRRARERRALGLVPEALERKAPRRGEERRASPRVPRRLWVVDDVEGGVAKVFEGEVGLGGASWLTSYPPMADALEVRFRVPEHQEEVKATAKLLKVAGVDGDARVRVVFTDLPLRHELALARYLDDCVTG